MTPSGCRLHGLERVLACRFSFPLSSLTGRAASRTPGPRQAGRRTNGHGEDHQEDRDGNRFSPALGRRIDGASLNQRRPSSPRQLFSSSSCLTVNSTRTSADTASMRTMLRRQTSAVGACAAGVALPATVLLLVGRHEYMPGSGVHFWASASRHPRDGRRARAHDRGLAAQRRAHGPRRHGLLGHGRAARAPRARDTRDDHGLRLDEEVSARSPAARRCSSALPFPRSPRCRPMTEPQSVNRLVVLQVILIVAIAILGAADARPERRPGRPRGRRSARPQSSRPACSSTPSSACGDHLSP